MALKRVVEKAEYDKLGSELKGLYAEKDGKWFLDVDDAVELSNALKRTRDELAAAKARFDGVDPDDYKRLKAQAEAGQRQRDLDHGNFDKVLGEERAKAEKERTLWDARTKKLEAALQDALVDQAAIRAIGQHDGNAALLLPYLKTRLRLHEVGDRQVAVVLDDKGQPRLREGATAVDDFMPISDAVAELRNDKNFAGAFKGTGASGSGQPRGMPPVPPDPRRATQRQQMEAIQQDLAAGKQKLSR